MLPVNENPVQRTLLALIDIARESRNLEDAWLYALTWITAYRLTNFDRAVGVSGINRLLSRESWDEERYDEIPPEAKALVWGHNAEAPRESSARTQALGVVSKLIEHSDSQLWDVIDTPWQLTGSGRGDIFGGIVMAPELCDLTFDVIGAEPGSTIWIPFDPTGQLVLRAVRRGLRVIAAGPGHQSDLHLKLLLAIEGANGHVPPNVQFEVPRLEMKRTLRADFLIATPPFGMKVQTGAGWRQWEGDAFDDSGHESLYRHLGSMTLVELDRSDAWAVAAFWPRISRRAVFLVSPNVLFAKGKELRLREQLVLKEATLSAVTLLPTRQLSNSHISSALLLLDRGHVQHWVRFTDATDMTIDSKSSMKFSKVLDLPRVRSLVIGEIEDNQTSCTVGFDEVAAKDFNLMPARYLSPALSDLGGPRRRLEELVTVIRAPVTSKDPTALIVQEAGFPELDRWREIHGPFSKTASIDAKKLEGAMLRPGDVLLSIKGTLGKSALVGAVPTVEPSFRHAAKKRYWEPIFPDASQAPVVPSQSCIALRSREEHIGSVLLFLYLRSDDFKKQIEALRVGASVAHVTPTTLLQEIWVPIPRLAEQARYVHRYRELCELEASIDDAMQRIAEIRSTLWPSEESKADKAGPVPPLGSENNEE
jgi:type I restriction-modification system DNA methylase subunit